MSADTFSNILAIDTAASVFSLALGTAGGQYYFEADAGQRHSQLVMDMADFLLKKAGIKPAELSLVACMNGPGSFTGLRIGFSCAKGLALSLDIPFIAVPSLDCMAYPYSMWPGLVLPAIDARKKSFFCALYSAGVRITDDMDASAETIAGKISEVSCGQEQERRLLVAGPDGEKLCAALRKMTGVNDYSIMYTVSRTGSARELLAIAKTRKASANSVYFNCGPEYLRKSDAEINAGK